MKLLPPSILPWRAPFDRRHRPPKARGRYGYRGYRACLRWEFGFTCPFCLCHEADLAPRGAEGLGITHIEHHVPVSHDPSGVNLYSNCFYACKLCNQDRGAHSNVEPWNGGRLLDPTMDIWEEHFVLDGDRFVAREGHRDALYTQEVYNLNNPFKIEMRRHRRETVEECLDFLERGLPMYERLFEKATRLSDPGLVAEARVIEDALLRAWRDLEPFAAVPRDAPFSCACGSETMVCTLPEVLLEQAIEVEPPFAGLDLDGVLPRTR